MNGWQRLYLIVTVLYSIYLVYFVVTTNDNYLSSSVNSIVRETQKENSSKLSYLTYQRKEVEFFSTLAYENGGEEWIKEFDSVVLKDFSKAEEILREQSKNPKEIVDVKNRYKTLTNILWDDAVINGPSNIAWKKYLQLIDSTKAVEQEKALNNYHQAYLNTIKHPKTKYQKMLVSLKAVANILLVFLISCTAFWAIPLLALYFGPVLFWQLIKWVKAGFKQ